MQQNIFQLLSMWLTPTSHILFENQHIQPSDFQPYIVSHCSLSMGHWTKAVHGDTHTDDSDGWCCHGLLCELSNRPVCETRCTSFELAYLHPSVPPSAGSHTRISSYSVRAHSCELSPSTVVNNWVSYLSCWICTARSRESPGSLQINWDQMNHPSSPQTTSLVYVFAPRVCVAGGKP